MNEERYGRPEDWKVGKLILVENRLAIEGQNSGFHCSEPLELEVAPGVWLRGSVELDHSTTITRGKQEHKGWYLNIGYHTAVLWLIPGMKARVYAGWDWPEPSTPYEGQTYKARYGGWRRYSGGQWIPEKE